MMKYLMLFLFAVMSALMPVWSSPVYRNTISNLHINSFAQDEQGFMWIATAKGLCRYDGYGFDIFSHNSHDGTSLPSDNVMGLYVDKSKRMWVATGNGVCLYDSDLMSFKRFRTISNSETFLFGLFEYKNGLYAYGLGGLYTVDEAKHRSVPLLKLDGREVWSVCVDAYGNIWCVCDKGMVFCFDGSLNLLRKFDFGLENEAYCSASVDNGRAVLFGTKRGLVKVNAKNLNIVSEVYDFDGRSLNINTLIQLDKSKDIFVLGTKNKGLVFYDIAHNKVVDCSSVKICVKLDSRDVRSLHIDRSGYLWVGSFDKGFYVCGLEQDVFNRDSRLRKTLNSLFVTRIGQDSSGDLWVGTRYNGLLHWNGGTAVWFNSDNTPALAKYNGDFVQELFIDSKDRLWFCYDQSVAVADIASGNFRLLKVFDNVGNVGTFAEDSNGRVWAGKSSGGMVVYDADLQHTENISPVLGHNNITKIIGYDRDNMLFSAFGDNIYKININTLKTTVLNPYYKKSWRNVVTMSRDRHGNVWIGTYGNGLLRYGISDGLLVSYKNNSGFQSNDIIGIVEDGYGQVWLSSSYGIYRLNPRSNRVQAFFAQDGVSGDQMHEKCVLKSRSGSLFFGGNGGLTEVLPQNIRPAAVDVPVYLTDFKLFNHSVSVDGSDGILDKVIGSTDRIVLKHDQNVFSLDFTGITYQEPPRLNYAYKLVGFDKEWNNVGTFKRASYSNLATGEYEFEVMVQNKDGLWSKPKRLLVIEVLPSPWLHPVAIFCYVVIALVALYYGIKIYIRLKLGKERYAMAQKEIARERAMAQMKMNFFTNISHELRTPLTMIYGPVKSLLSNRNIAGNKEYSSMLTLIGSNVERLLRLVDQLLDFGRVENDTLELKVSRNDCIMQLKSIINLYRLYVADKDMTVDFDCHYDSLNIVYDPDKLDKIMNNLLFNASKYTPVGGHVMVRCELVRNADGFGLKAGNCNAFLEISVEDDGIGLDKHQIVNLFGRFKRLVSGKNAERIKGSGIGLNFVKHLVENHKGAIKAENLSGKGCRFTFVIPVDDAVYSEEEHAFSSDKVGDGPFTTGVPNNVSVDSQAVVEQPENEVTEEGQSVEPVKKHTVLVVEDNEDVRTFLNDILGIAGYDVTTAINGVDGLQKAAGKEPDVIISDVIMPEMDGFEFCNKVKTNKDLCHIPVVLLTAKNMDNDRVEGYRLGADMYLAKPFNPDELLQIVANFIQSSERRRRYIMKSSGIATSYEQSEAQEPDLSPLDKKFLKKLYDYIEANISDSELDVNFLGRELGFSRTNFYRKVKALTGATPSDFLRNYRLNRAAELIRQRELSLSEIGERAGFGTQSHFSTTFKKHFGVSPKDYLSSIKKP